MWRSLTLGITGTVAGLIIGIIILRSLRALLYGVEPADPATLFVGAAALLMIVLLASYLPARRAARLDPAVALRAE